MPKNEISTNEDLLVLLDELLEERSAEFWTRFYVDPNRKCPFFTPNPNEDLFELVETGKIAPPVKVLEIGCGNGRNSNYLARRGFEVEAVDFSETAIAAARENAPNDKVSYFRQSVFDFDLSGKTFDFVYDSGCFHHIAPHRRPEFLSIVSAALNVGGLFALVCFAPGGGSDFSDAEVYEKRSLGGGLSFSEESLEKIFAERFHDLNIRRMKEFADDSGLFGKEFLWAVNMRKIS